MNLQTAIERMRDVLRRQHMALATESSYVYWLRHYMIALKSLPAALSSEHKLEHFLTNLARHRDLSATSQNQAFNAVLYFYKEVLRQPLHGVDALRANRPARLRHAPTVAETQALLQIIKDRAGYPTNLIARLLMAAAYVSANPSICVSRTLILKSPVFFSSGPKVARIGWSPCQSR
jgi:Phage integrase, N-terminal SAM-like domain